MFLLCMPKEIRSKYSLWEHPRERLKFAACLLGVIVGAVTLGLSAVRLPGASTGTQQASNEVNDMLIVSVALSAAALIAGIVSGYLLVLKRSSNAYSAVSLWFALLTVAAGGIISGLNFWILEVWAPDQPPNSFNETRLWEQDTAKTAGFGIALFVVGCVHVVLLGTDFCYPLNDAETVEEKA